MRWLFWAMLPFALASCAGMDAAECRTADWRAIGYEDGAQGQTPDYFGERRKACADHGVTANFEDYRAGRAEGLVHFCSPYNGYRQGTQGRAYSGVCPADLEQAFVAAHADGYGLYARQAEIKRIRKDLNRSRERSKAIEHQVVEKTALLVSPDIATADRATLAVELKQLAEEKGQLDARIAQLKYDQILAEQDYEHYQNRLASWQ